jgi:hypothetical protein
MDLEYLFFGTHAMFHCMDDDWKAWCEPVWNAVVLAQRRDACANGSWDPAGIRGAKMSRVKATAMNALTLLVYNRYRLYVPKVRNPAEKK